MWSLGIHVPLASAALAETSHNIDCLLGSFCYIRAVIRLNCLTAQPSYKGRAAVGGGGGNSISKFDHHNINGGAVDIPWRLR
jgi:hypothetical protein